MFFLKTFFSFLLVFTFSFSAQAKRLLILGDSLTEGYGVSRESAYPSLLEKKIQVAHKNWSVINAGVSGATSANGISQLKWQLKKKPDLILLCLGANDGLRGLKIDQLEKNLSMTIELAQKEKIPILLMGMKMPPNYSKTYVDQFDAVYPRIAKKYSIPLLPFLLEGVGARPELNQADGIHPNEKGHRIVAETVFQFVKGYL